MPKCDACGAEGARHRCSKCQACWFCRKACAKRAWRWHKLHCTDDPALKRHVSVEMAFERVLAKQPKTEVPEGAQCYICLDGGDNLLRECACRGASGFVHVDCLAEMAKRDEWLTVEGERRLHRWTTCGTCHQRFTLALLPEMLRRWWRHYRDTPDMSEEKRGALQLTAHMLRDSGEIDTADRLANEATQGLTRDDPIDILGTELLRALHLIRANNPTAALETLTGLRASIGRCQDLGFRAMYAHATACALSNLGRAREALPVAAESVELATSHHGPESSMTLNCGSLYAVLLADVGRVREGRAELERVLATQTRVFGAAYPATRETKAALDRVAAMRA